MTAFSISSYRGWASASFQSGGGFAINDYNIGALAPSASYDIELRFQLQDANSKNLTREDVILFLRGVAWMLEQGGIQLPAGTPWIGSPNL